MNSVNGNEDMTYTFDEDPSGKEGRKLIDSKGFYYSLTDKSIIENTSIWVCKKIVDRKCCKGKVQLTNNRKLILMKEHNHRAEVKNDIYPYDLPVGDEVSFRSKSAAKGGFHYVLKHVPAHNSLKLYESRGYDYALKFQDALGNSRWRCQHTNKNKLCPGQVCIILEDHHQLSVLTEHFHTPFSTPQAFEELYDSVTPHYNTFAPEDRSYDRERDLVATFTDIQLQPNEKRIPQVPNVQPQNVEVPSHLQQPSSIQSSNSIESKRRLQGSTELSQAVSFKFINHKSFPNQQLLCDSRGFAYDFIGKLGSNKVFCCQEIYHNNVKCRAELLQDLNNKFIICTNHNHSPQDKMVKYLDKNNVFREVLNEKKRPNKSSLNSRRKRMKRDSSAESFSDSSF